MLNARILIIIFLVSIGTYPIEELRIIGFPLPVLILPALIFLFANNLIMKKKLLLFHVERVLIISSVLLFFWLLIVGLGASAIMANYPDFNNYKGVAYILLLPLLGLMLRDENTHLILWALMCGCFMAVLVGYYRFETLNGGLLSEHMLGYWGIRYQPSTRNSDVLYPLVCTFISFELYKIERANIKRTVVITISVMSVLAVVLSMSRGAWIALVAGFLFGGYLFTNRSIFSKGRKLAVISIVSISMVGIFAIAEKYENVSTNNLLRRLDSITGGSGLNSSNQSRIDLVGKSIEAMFKYPLGVGPGNVNYVMGKRGQEIGNMENAWLTLGVEGGWPAIVIFLIIVLSLFKIARILPNNKCGNIKKENNYIGLPLLTGVVVYLMFNYELNSLFLWAVLAVVWGAACFVPFTNINKSKVGVSVSQRKYQ